MASETGYEFNKIKALGGQAWGSRSGWDQLYQEAYDYAIPFRRPGGNGIADLSTDNLFDMTALTSAMHFAGNLQRDLFPSGLPSFTLKTGPVARMALSSKEVSTYDNVLGRQANRIHPFFQAGDFDTAIHEMCIDLSVGTGALIPLKGTSQKPVEFAAIPFDQIAIITNMTGRPTYVSWKQSMSIDQVLEKFPNGTFSEGFSSKKTLHGNQKVTLKQDFFQDPRGPNAGWHFVAYLDDEEQWITHERYRTQPIAVVRYYRVPGEAYGRGVILTALPSIKTVNKAQEIALKSAAIQMLGIWGYRAGGTFNPDTVRIGPGEMWPMQSTGGILGPDVQRIDPASGRLDVARMLIGNLQDQIREAMFDTRLPEYQGTPKAASEIAARMRQKADIHIGAFGRLVREIMPVIVPRVTEILHGFGLMSQLPMQIDELLMSIEVQSPMAAALNADRLASIANYLEFVGSIAGAENVELYANIDKVMERVGEGLQIDKELIPNEDQRKQIEDKIAKRQQAQLIQLFGEKFAEKAPDMIAQAEAENRKAA